MIFRNLDENSDWRFGKGRNDFTQRNQAIGVDWYNRLGSKNQQTLLEADIRRIILQSEGVTGILTFDTILEGRSFTANYSVSTIFSESYRDSIILGS
jgi:hypothetical protein